jgi:hypothetical protein
MGGVFEDNGEGMNQTNPMAQASPRKLLEQLEVFLLEDNLVIYHAPTARYWLLNRLARAIYLALAQNHPVSDLPRRLAREHDLSEEQARGMVSATLADWAGSGLWGDGRWSPQAESPPPLSWERLRPSWEGVQAQHFTLWGVPFGLAVNNPSLAKVVLNLYHAFATTEPQPGAPIFHLLSHDGLHYLFRDGELVESDLSSETVVTQLMLETYQLVLGPQEVLAVLHAGAVVRRDKAWLLCGASWSGKSTLTAALAASGMPCLTDDTALLCAGEPNPRLKALPLAVKLRQTSWELLRPYHPRLDQAPCATLGANQVRFLTCEAVAPDPGRQGYELGAILLPDRTPGQEAGCFRISATEALARMIAGSSWIDPDPGRMARVLSVLFQVPAYLVRFSGLEQSLALLKQIPSS